VADTRAVELPWSIVSSRWGEGLATEAAAAALDTARAHGIADELIVAFALRDNAASLRVMEKIGLRRVGAIEHAGLPHVLYSATGSAPPRR
jgi:RimJ/RimL family protein N-acetyltransferase